MMRRQLICLAVVCSLFPALSFAGIEWTATITSTGKGKEANKVITTHAYAQAGNLKQVFEGVSDDDMYYLKNGYWLYKSGEDNIYIVNEKEEKYTIISMDQLLQITGAVGQIAQIEIVDHSINVEELARAELLGYPCNHFKVTTNYTMRIKIAFIKKAMKVLEVKEIWSTPEMQEIDQINSSFQSKQFRTGIPDLDKMIQKEIEHQQSIGFPLKVITNTIQMNKKGKKTNESSTLMTVNEILFTTFPEGFFEIPRHFDAEQSSWDSLKLK
jgi:hypothetical protein